MRLVKILAMGVVGALPLLGHFYAASAHNDLPWSGCSYSWFLDAGNDIWVKVASSAQFPGNTNGDGVMNSFGDRIANDVTELDAALGRSGAVAGGAIQYLILDLKTSEFRT